MRQEISPYRETRTIVLRDEDVVSSARLVNDEAPSLRDYWQVVRKHKWKIVACFFAAVVCATIYVFSQTPIYTASATLVIERKGAQVVNIQQVLSEGVESDSDSYYQSQAGILRSRSVAAEVIKQKRLDTHPVFIGDGAEAGFVAKFLADIKAWVTGSLTEVLQGQKPKSPLQTQGPGPLGVDSRLIDAYQGMLDVELVKKSRLAQIKFSTPDPVLSATIANAHARAYIHQGQKLRSQANEDARKFLETKLAELRERVEQSEDALNRFRKGKGIISLDDKENIVVDRLADLNKRLTDAEAERIGLEAHARLIKSRAYDSLPAVISNSLIQSLKGQLVNLEAQYAQLATQYKSGYPPVAKLQAQIEETKQRLSQQIASVVEGINSAYLAAVAKEKDLRTQMDQQKSAALALKDAAVEYAILFREANTNTQLYNAVLERMKEIGVAAEIPTSNVSILDSAEIPRLPSKPNKKLTLMLGAVMGLMGGLGLALFSEHLDNTLKTPEDVQRHTGLPNLAVVPDFLRLPKVRRKSQLGSIRQSSFHSRLCVPAGSVMASGQQLSMVTEAYRKLRTSISLSRPEQPPKTILFSSGTAGEGKTITAVNSAIMFAQIGSPVLLVDADLRRPACHRALKISNKGGGLTDFLAGQEVLEKVIKPTKVPNLSLLTCGRIPSNPTELLGSKAMRETLRLVKERFDFIVIDSSPVVPFSDAVVLSMMVDGIVFVVRGQDIRGQLINTAISQFEHSRAKILGFVLNRIDARSAEYADYYRYHYAPYYSYEANTKGA